MDRLDAMASFVAIADSGSFTAASRRLDLPLATVSRRLAELEKHLGARLLTRSTRQLALTDVGRRYLAACKQILGSIDDAERAAIGEYNAPKGELVVTAPIAFGRLHLLPIIEAFLTKYPEINIRMILSDRNAHLLDDHIDIALRIGPLADSAMIASQLGTVRRMVCASPKFLKEHGSPMVPTDLSSMDCVTFDVLGSADVWNFRCNGREVGVPVRSRLAVNTAEAAVDAAVAGVGLTRVVSYQAEPAVRDGLLQPVLEEFELEPAPVSLVYIGQGSQPLKLRSFIDFAAPRLRQALKGLSGTRASI